MRFAISSRCRQSKNFSLPSSSKRGKIFLLTNERRERKKKLNTRQNDKLTGISEYYIWVQSRWRQIFKMQWHSCKCTRQWVRERRDMCAFFGKFLGIFQQIFHLIVLIVYLQKFKFIDWGFLLRKFVLNLEFWVFRYRAYWSNFQYLKLIKNILNRLKFTKHMVIFYKIQIATDISLFSFCLNRKFIQNDIVTHKAIQSKNHQQQAESRKKNSIWIHIKFGLNQNLFWCTFA